MTKHVCVHDEALKNQLTIEDAKVEVVPKMNDDPMVMGSLHIGTKPKRNMKVTMIKQTAHVKRTSRLSKATQNLYDLEESTGPEKTLNIDLDLYQMEDY